MGQEEIGQEMDESFCESPSQLAPKVSRPKFEEIERMELDEESRLKQEEIAKMEFAKRTLSFSQIPSGIFERTAMTTEKMNSSRKLANHPPTTRVSMEKKLSRKRGKSNVGSAVGIQNYKASYMPSLEKNNKKGGPPSFLMVEKNNDDIINLL